jgi:hypothetical protein
MWLLETTVRERRTLLAAWHMSNADAGYIATAALLTSAAGGWAAAAVA